MRAHEYFRSYSDMNSKKKTAAIAVAAVFACGALAGCDSLTVRNLAVDYARTVATVNIGTSAAFQDADGEFAAYKDVADLLVGTSEITKRELVMSFLSSGSTLVQSYGLSVEQAFDYLLDSLIQRASLVQYAKAYLVKNGDADGKTYTTDGLKAAVDAVDTDAKKEAAGLEYFLTAPERDKAKYDLRVAINDAIDSQEQTLIKLSDAHDHTADSDVRTTPTGADTVSEDFYDTDYRIYTGRETNLGTYEKLEGSTVATRKEAYNRFVEGLFSGDQLKKGENSADLENTDYFANQLIAQYESAIINKLEEKFRHDATVELSAVTSGEQSWAAKLFQEAVDNQKAEFSSDKSAFEDAFNSISDTSYVFAPYDRGYGYVLNILLPFSTLQTEELGSFTGDLGDAKGGKYAARARLLEKVKATDQRETWFTGHNDYSYKADEYYGKGAEGRDNYLFFENSLEKSDDVLGEGDTVVRSAQYEKIKNYLGMYSYNGKVIRDEDGDVEKFEPNYIGIDGFLDEMKGYMQYASAQKEINGLTFDVTQAVPADYFTRENFYNSDGEVDYDAFIYESGKLGYFEGNKYNPDNIFVEGKPENVAFSVMNELSFAYNTDTAGLNSYLGYMISPYQTSYMKEFEHAAQVAVQNGAGSYVVVPTDYGWHIIYCTFSFMDVEEGASAFTFDQSQAEGGENELENSFSWNFFEQLKSANVDAKVSSLRSDVLATYAEDCSEKFEYVYRDLLSL